MSIRYLDFSGAVNFWTNIKNYILSKIPTKTSELTNDSGFLTQHQSLSNYVTLDGTQTIAGTKTFSSTISGSISGNAGTATQFSANTTVALTGDATGTSAGSKKGWSVPVTLANSGVTAGTYGPSADVTGNNNATILVPEITVDAKGRVTSVTNRTLTCKNNTYNVYDKTLTIQKNGTNVATFTSNSNTDVTANITVPTKVSELTNDSGYLTSHQSLDNYVTLNTAQEITNAKTFKNAYTVRKLTSVEAGNVIPSSDKLTSDIWQDKNGKELGRIYYVKSKSGTTGLVMRAGDWFTSNEGVYTLDASGTNRRAELQLYTDSSGNCCIKPVGLFSTHIKPLDSSVYLGDSTKPFGRVFANAFEFCNAGLLPDTDVQTFEEHSIGFFGKNNTPLSYITFQKRPNLKDRIAVRVQTAVNAYKSYCFDATCFYPEASNNLDIGSTTNIFKNIYCNNYYLGTTAFGDIVTHNASEFLTSHQSLSSCVKNVVTNNQTIKSTGITRGTAPSSAQTFGIAFSDKNNKYIGNIYGQYATDKSTYVGLYAYKGTTTENGDNASVRVGYDASGNVYTSAPTPATTDNSTQIATTAFVKAQGYLTSHQSLANYLTKTTNVSEMGRYIDLHYDNATAKYDYDVRLYVDSQGTAKGGGSFKISAASAYAPAPASDANDTRIATTAWVNSKGYLTSHPSITLSTNTTSTASPAHGGTFTCIDSVTQDTNGHITKVNTKTVTLPSDSNTDTKVTQTVTTANSGYPVLLCATANATATETTTSRFSAGLTVNTRYSTIYMTNKYDTANTKGVRNTSSYGNGYIVFRCYDASEMGRIHCESSKNGYQQTYIQARSYIKNGAISPEGTATTCYITVRVRDNGSRTIYTDGSWENSLIPYANNTHSLGTSSLQWKNAYAKNFYENGTALSDKYLTVSAISGGASTDAGNITPVKGTIISGFAESSQVTYSTDFGGVLTSTSCLYYATGVYDTTNSTMTYSKGPSVGGTGTWKLMGGGVENPGFSTKLLFGLWIKIV